jgi:beta-glucanase (GH16 family)
MLHLASRQSIGRRTVLLVILLVIGSASPPVFSQCALVTNCTLVWSDEFDGTAVDTNKWEFMIGDGSAYGIPGWGNNELQFYGKRCTHDHGSRGSHGRPQLHVGAIAHPE